MASLFHAAAGTSWHWITKGDGSDLGMTATEYSVRDNGHQLSIFRSTPFYLSAATEISLSIAGGKGESETVDGVNVDEYTTSSIGSGFMGVAIRSEDTNRWIISKRRSNNNYDHETITFESAELGAHAGKHVTLDLIDAYHGGWGWIAVKQVIFSGSQVLTKTPTSALTTAPTSLPTSSPKPAPTAAPTPTL